MRILVLGSAAGGGFPQWNCRCANCRRAWAGDPATPRRTQSSLAVTADGVGWLLLNASPDIRQQIIDNPPLHPRGESRESPLLAVALTNADVDHVAGLLSLRERQPITVYATQRVHEALAANPIFRVLDPSVVARRTLNLGATEAIMAVDGAPMGLTIEAFRIPGKTALYLENPQASAGFGTVDGDTVGFEVRSPSRGARFLYLPGCAAIDERLTSRLTGAELVFFDGTLWRDNEMIEAGLGTKTGARMGHLSMAGDDGSLAQLARLGVRRGIYVHINNSNPVIVADSLERRTVEQMGFEVAHDGQEIVL